MYKIHKIWRNIHTCSNALMCKNIYIGAMIYKMLHFLCPSWPSHQHPEYFAVQLLWEDVCTPMKNLNTLLQWIPCLQFSHIRNVYKRETVRTSASLAPTYSTWTLVSTEISRQQIWRQHNIGNTDTLAGPNIIISSLTSGSSLAISLISKALYSMCLFEVPGRWLAARTVYVRVSVNGS